MASEASRKKAEELCTEEHQSWHTPECGQCANLAAALDEAEKRGAERERWECHEAIKDAAHVLFALHMIAARGPMRGPEEE